MRIVALAGVVVGLMAGCPAVDNSGGRQPAGEPVEAHVVVDEFFCSGVIGGPPAPARRGTVIRNAAEFDAFFRACPDPETGEPRYDAEDAARAAFTAMEDGQALVAVEYVVGGCESSAAIRGFYKDEATVVVWVLAQDQSYGVDSDLFCSFNFGGVGQLVVVDGAAATTSIRVAAGRTNPDLPGGPDVDFDVDVD